MNLTNDETKTISLNFADDHIGTISYDHKKDIFNVKISEPLFKFLLHSDDEYFDKMPEFLRLEDGSFSRKSMIRNYELESLSQNEQDWKILNIFLKDGVNMQRIRLNYVQI